MEQSTIDCLIVILAYAGLLIQYIMYNICKNTIKIFRKKLKKF